VSVSSHLADRSSPVRAFFERELNDTRPLVAEANATLRAGRDEPLIPTRGNPGLVGTAADILLNAWLDPSVSPGRQAESPTFDGAVLVGNSQRALMDRFAAEPNEPTANEWSELARHALMIASFVSSFRSRVARQFLAERLRGASAQFDEYARRLWTADDEQDLLALAPAALEDHAFARSAAYVVVNPVFTLSERLGGGDADLIAGRTLWDYKSSGQSRIVRREEIWQLAAYLLADADGEHELRAVGISALRWRTRHSWDADEFLSQLSGSASGRAVLADWRERFAGVAAALPLGRGRGSR
jgi:hypothetical protein